MNGRMWNRIVSSRSCQFIHTFLAGHLSNLDKNPIFPHLTLPNFCPLSFSAAGAVFEPHVPAVPAANDLSHLHNAFAEWASQVWTEILYGIDAVIPLKQCNVQTFCL